nr:hypothetical protein [uncultured Undibacterium sp.]
MATPNYGYEKRQKELAKKRKKEEKLKNRAERAPGSEGDQDESDPDIDTPKDDTGESTPP